MGTVQKILHVFNALGKRWALIHKFYYFLRSLPFFFFLSLFYAIIHAFFSLLWRIIQIIKVAAIHLERKIVDLIKKQRRISFIPEVGRLQRVGFLRTDEGPWRCKTNTEQNHYELRRWKWFSRSLKTRSWEGRASMVTGIASASGNASMATWTWVTHSRTKQLWLFGTVSLFTIQKPQKATQNYWSLCWLVRACLLCVCARACRSFNTIHT